MNTPWQAVWLLAVETSGVVAVTGLIAWRLRSVVWQRTLWQASLLALTGLLLVEFSSLNLFRASREQPAPVTSVAVPNLALSTPAVTPIGSSSAVPVAESYQPIATVSPEPFTMPELAPMPSPKELAPLDIHAEAVVAQTNLPKDSFPLALALVLGVWVICALVLASRLLVGRFILLRFCARSQTVFDVALFERVQGIARKLGLKQSVQVLEASRIHTPVVFGLFRLTIALPAGFTERFDRRQQEAILAHELAHLAARDPLWYLLADGLVSVLWWHPLVWLARARLQVTSEMAADEACVLAENGPETLAECLVTIAQEISTPGSLESIGIEGSGFRSRLGQRVERLLKLSAEMVSQPAAWHTGMVKLGMPVLLVGVLVISSGWMRRDDANALKELPGMTWATLRTAVEIPPENKAKRERVPLPVAKSIELAQITNSLTPKIVQKERKWDISTKLNTNDVPNLQSNVIRGREQISRKLDSIVVKELAFDRVPLSDVIRFLVEESVEQDTQKQMIRFVINSNLPKENGITNSVNLKLDDALITIKPALKGKTMVQCLDAVMRGAQSVDGYSIQYRVDDFGVTILPASKPVYLVTQFFVLDRDEVQKVFGGEKVRKLGDTNLSVVITEKLRNYLKNAGVNSVTNSPKSFDRQMFYIEPKGHLIVRASLQELDVIREWLKGRLQNVVLGGVRLPNSVPSSVDLSVHQKNGKQADILDSAKPAEEEARVLSDNKVRIARLVEEGRRLRVAQRLQEAEAYFREANKLDPSDKSVDRALEEVQELITLIDYRQLYAEQELHQSASSFTNPTGKLPPPNPYVRTQVAVAPAKARVRIEEMLDKVVLKELYFDGLPLSKVTRFLEEESIKQDPEKRGVNFIINSNLDNQPGIRGDTNAAMVDLEKVIITISPPLKNLTMREALTAITNATARAGTNSLAFSVNDYAVVFRQYMPQPPQMFVRRFKVDPDSFLKGLKKVAANSGLTNITTSTNIQDMWREYIRYVGVKTDTNSMTASQVFYNDTTGILLVRASLQDLEIIQQAIEVLNMGKAQVTIEAKYIEVTDKVAKELGLTWFTTAALQETNKGKVGVFLNSSIPTNHNVRVEAPILPNHVSILSPKQAKALLQKFNSTTGVDVLSSPRVTTVNNRQARIEVGENLTVAVEKQLNPIVSTNGQPDVQTHFLTSPVITGPALDIVPTVSADGNSLKLNWTICLTQFLGYDKPSKGMEKNEPLPRFRVRQVANTNVVRDGQTLLVGCGMTESSPRTKTRSDGLFTTDTRAEKKHVIVLLTARIIDPAGNPVNRDEELGY